MGTRVLTHYRATLRLCCSMGYKYGRWNEKYVFDYTKLNNRGLDAMIRHGILGDVVWNNVRHRYKEGVCASPSQKDAMIRAGDIVFKQLTTFMPIYFRKRHRYMIERFS